MENRPIRLLVSLLSVSAMFGLGRWISSKFNLRRKARTETSGQSADGESIVIHHVQPETVYEHARRLDYFEHLRQHDLQFDVIAEQPGEFFGLRMEYNGELYGTALMRFEQTPGRDFGTIVTITTRYKHRFTLDELDRVEPAVSREVRAYLQYLEQSFAVANAV